MPPDSDAPPLESVLCTEELDRRPRRAPDHATENRALAALAQALADSPGTILQVLAETILTVFRADTAGVSLLSADEQRFDWAAIAGRWQLHHGGGTPRAFGPCGDVLDRDAPLLFKHFERRYAYLRPMMPAAEEALLVPFHVKGKALGTVWAIAHDARRRFDAEDARQLQSVARFAAAAHQTPALRKFQDSRRAALNLMEDALQARQAMEMLNVELRDRERRLRAMIDALPAAVYTTDAAGLLTHFNPAAAEFAGRTPEIGKDRWCISWKLFRADGTPLPHEQCPMAIALGEGRDVRGEQIIAERPDGTRRWLEPYPTPLRDAEGRVTGGINMLVDITASKQAEQALRDADNRKNEFLAMLAHELRNPLAPIRNSLAILRRTAGAQSSGHEPGRRQLDPIVQSGVLMMERQVGQMVRLVDDLLDVSRISRGTIELRRAPVELSLLVQQVVEAARPHCQSLGVELTLALPPQPVMLNADPDRLAQIIGNLVNNAGKFTDGGGRIDVTVEVEVDGATLPAAEADAASGPRMPQVVVRVRDTGIGLAPDQLARIFQMFTQVDASLGRSAGGLGIGLALVKDLVELHGGTVAAHSAGLGQGSEVVVRLPIIAPATVAPATPPTPATIDAAAGRALQILVVDDNRDAAESLAFLLQLNGHETRMAHDGVEAVQAAASFRPDVILLDIGLPKLDGFEAARRIRSQTGAKRPLLVALTGWGQEEDRRRSAQAGFDAHLVKPVDVDALLKLLVIPAATAPTPAAAAG